MLKSTRLGLRNSVTRIPFRYGNACLTACPQAILQATIESEGRTCLGYSGDCLPPSWFDKSPHKSYRQQTAEMLDAIAFAEASYRAAFQRPASFFAGWHDAYHAVQQEAARRDLPPLLASFGSSLVERAMLDAICRWADLPFAVAVRQNLFGVEGGRVHDLLQGHDPSDWLPRSPDQTIFVRHTVGLTDPLTASDVEPADRLQDSLPQTLEQYLDQGGLRYFKVKVCNQLDRDLSRLLAIADLVERRHGVDYQLTIDGNEQYRRAADFEELVESIRAEPRLSTLWDNVLAIEQPLERSVALEAEHTQGIRDLAAMKAVIIDESDGGLPAYPLAVELGYRGVSSKSCKGVIKGILNAGLTWTYNQQGRNAHYLMTGEDLCTVGVVAVQSDLCLVATLGLKHVERNGHHYHRGLSYLSQETQQAALAAHEDFYQQTGSFVAPRLSEGRFQIGSLQCPGFGFAVEPNLGEMCSAADWTFDSLGAES